LHAIKQATAAALPRPSVVALQGHAVDAACGGTARWSGQRWRLERDAAKDRMVMLAALTNCGGAVTAPSSKAGNDCDAFFSAMDEDKEPMGISS
jgi:hypothetical protein